MTIGIIAVDPRELGEKSLGQRIDAVGHNTGNLAFSHAVTSHVAEPISYVSWQDHPKDVAERCRVLVIPEASAMNPVRDYASRAEFLNEARLPLVAVGLGAQARRIGDHVPLTPGTVDYVRALSAWSDVIGVRGVYSGEVLKATGVSNYEVTGCPSNFLNPNESLGVSISDRMGHGAFARAVLTQGDQKKVLRPVERKALRWVRGREGHLVAQSGATLTAAVAGVDALSLRLKYRIRRHLGVPLWRRWRGESVGSWVGVESRAFFSIPEWVDFLSAMDIAFGTRIHGNILAVQSGTPGICVYHDSRTDELCRSTQIPRVSISEFMVSENLEDLVAEAKFSGDSFDTNRREMARVYVGILQKAGVAVQQDLLSLAGVESSA